VQLQETKANIAILIDNHKEELNKQYMSIKELRNELNKTKEVAEAKVRKYALRIERACFTYEDTLSKLYEHTNNIKEKLLAIQSSFQAKEDEIDKLRSKLNAEREQSELNLKQTKESLEKNFQRIIQDITNESESQVRNLLHTSQSKLNALKEEHEQHICDIRADYERLLRGKEQLISVSVKELTEQLGQKNDTIEKLRMEVKYQKEGYETVS
jgi:chromosome segregation ATPase